MTGTAGVGEEVGSHGFDAALGCGRKATNGLEIFLCGPTLREDRQRNANFRVHIGGRSLSFLYIGGRIRFNG
jgi:hypothetical protein